MSEKDKKFDGGLVGFPNQMKEKEPEEKEESKSSIGKASKKVRDWVKKETKLPEDII